MLPLASKLKLVPAWAVVRLSPSTVELELPEPWPVQQPHFLFSSRALMQTTIVNMPKISANVRSSIWLDSLRYAATKPSPRNPRNTKARKADGDLLIGIRAGAEQRTAPLRLLRRLH